jgi:hypothetical protein
MVGKYSKEFRRLAKGMCREHSDQIIKLRVKEEVKPLICQPLYEGHHVFKATKKD